MSAKAIHTHDNAERRLVGFGQLRVLICEEEGEWFAQGVEIDYAASGESLAEVQRRFEKGLAATVHLYLSRFQSIERLLKYPPSEVWQRLKPVETFALNMLTTHDLGAAGDALRELPFGQIVYLRETPTRHAASTQG